jgi:rhamnulokinase/L-fuculokinase
MRCIYESLALKYRLTFEKLMDCTGKNYPVIHIIGGGTKDTLLCRMTASSCNRRVLAGPVEATVLGNIAVQLLAQGDIKNIAQAREIIAGSENVAEYYPENAEEWDKAYDRYIKIL